jgi:hypothetical protein
MFISLILSYEYKNEVFYGFSGLEGGAPYYFEVRWWSSSCSLRLRISNNFTFFVGIIDAI